MGFVGVEFVVVHVIVGTNVLTKSVYSSKTRVVFVFLLNAEYNFF